MKKVLLVEDDEFLATELSTALRKLEIGAEDYIVKVNTDMKKVVEIAVKYLNRTLY